MATTRELVHAAIRAADKRGCCNLPGCAFPPRPGQEQHVETMLCDELVAAFDARSDAVLSALAGLDKYVSLNCWQEDGVGEYVVTAQSIHDFVVETRKLLAGLTDRGGR